MKKTLNLMLVSVLMLPIFAITNVQAEENDATSNSPTASEQAKPKKTQPERVAERKAKIEAKLSELQKTQVAGRCKATSAIIANVQKRVTKFEANRPDVYGNLVTRFETLGPKLKQAEVDTATYDQQLAELKQQVAVFDTDVAKLKQTVDDLASLDCATDPEGFVATVKESIVLRQSVIAKGREVRAYLRDTLRPTLVDIQKQLATKTEVRG